MKYRVYVVLALFALQFGASCDLLFPVRRSDAKFGVARVETYRVARLTQFIASVTWGLSTSGGTGYPPHTFESGARFFLCDIDARTATLLCDVKLPEPRYGVREVFPFGWTDGAIYFRLLATGDESPDRAFFYRVAMSGGCEPVPALPEYIKPMVNWSGWTAFLETEPRPDDWPSFFPETNCCLGPERRGWQIVVRPRVDAAAEPAFEVRPDDGTIVPAVR